MPHKVARLYSKKRKDAHATRVTADTFKEYESALPMTALDAFEVDNGYYPKGKSGLNDLVQAPRDAQSWRGPYLKEVPKDPWNNDYLYECPGRRNPTSYDLSSGGPDGKTGSDDDITNWQTKK